MKTCSVDDCSNPIKGRGMCRSHYMRWWRRNPDVEKIPPTYGLPDYERFMTYVDDSAGPNSCHLWTAARTEYGYGYFQVAGRSWKAPRWLLGYQRGRHLEPDEWACHICDNPPCVNPAHLYIGDATSNNRDTVLRGRRHPDQGGIVSAPRGDHTAGAARAGAARARAKTATRTTHTDAEEHSDG